MSGETGTKTSEPNPFQVIGALDLSWQFKETGKCDLCEKRRKLKGKRRNERLCRQCEFLVGGIEMMEWLQWLKERMEEHYDKR